MKKSKRVLALLAIFTLPVLASAQYCIDGSYCPIPSDPPGNCISSTVTDEWGNAQSFVVNPSPSSTCEVGTVYGDFGMDALGDYYFYFAISHGNNGQSTFRFYLNTDCDTTTGAQSDYASGSNGALVDVNGADYKVIITSNGSLDTIVAWDNTLNAFVATAVTVDMAVGNSNGCSGSDGSFKELMIPFNGFIEPCGDGPCGGVTITTILSNAGGSLNSNLCSSPAVSLHIPINLPPIPDLTLQRDTACEKPIGVYPSVFVDASISTDPNLIYGDSIYYVWSSSNSGTFSNTSGGPLGAGQMSQINTTYSPLALGNHELTLTLTDQFLCDSATASGVTDYTYVVLPTTDPYCWILPVELLNFDADVSKSYTTLHWATASEMNNDHFVIEHALKGMEFEAVGTVKSQNSNSNQLLEYEFIHANVDRGLNYYRLKQVDVNGDYSYSDIRFVNFEGEYELKVFPNPGTGLIQIEMPQSGDNIHMVQLYNSYGQLIRVIEHIEVDTRFLELNLLDLPSGMYYLSVEGDVSTYRQPLLLTD